MSEKTIFFDRVHIILTNRANRGAAFEQALKPDSNYDHAGWSLGLLYLYSKDKTCADSKKAFDIFSRFYNLVSIIKIKRTSGMFGYTDFLDIP